MQKNIVKVLLICHFSNPEIRAKLKLRQDMDYHDFAVWITNHLAAYAGCDELEMHVVAPHKGMRMRTQCFESDGIYYYFFNAWSYAGKCIETGLNYAIYMVGKHPIVKTLYQVKTIFWSIAFMRHKRYVRSLVKSIRPDIVHLSGSENPYYSSTIFKLENCRVPICLNPQGILDYPIGNCADNSKVKLQRTIHRNVIYFFVGSIDHYMHIKSLNPLAHFFHMPGIRTINIDPSAISVVKKYSFVFFARIDPIKGIEHLLKAISMLKSEYPEVSLLMLGPVSQRYLDYLEKLCCEYGISDNVTYGGFIKRRQDLFRLALSARAYILPTTVEGLATSAVEAMLLGLPVVTYATGGMPFLNKDGENVLMCKNGDIEGLIKNMKLLLDDLVFAKELALRGQSFAKRTFGEKENVLLIIRQYRAIIEHYHRCTPIPEDLLFTGEYE